MDILVVNKKMNSLLEALKLKKKNFKKLISYWQILGYKLTQILP